MSRDTTFAETDHRNYNRDGAFFSQGETFSGLPFELAVEITERMRPWMPREMTMAQAATRWILDQPAVSTVITGATELLLAQPDLDDKVRTRLLRIARAARQSADITTALLHLVRAEQGIDQDTGKKISKDVRGEGFKKVQVQIQGDELRIIAPSKDTLQEVMAWLRAQDYGVELKFGNYR